MSEDEKLDELVEFLTEHHLGFHGGYPYDFTWVGDTLVIAGLDDGKDRNATQISMYRRENLLAWYDRAEAMAANTDLEVYEAIWETE